MITETLTGTTLVFPLNNIQPPVTVFLTSEEVGRKLEFSVDGGVNYFSPSLDVEVTKEIITHADSPITHIKATGKAGDILGLVFNVGG